MIKARKEEILYFKQMGVYDKVDNKESYDVTGKAPIADRWVDVNKGDSASPKGQALGPWPRAPALATTIADRRSTIVARR